MRKAVSELCIYKQSVNFKGRTVESICSRQQRTHMGKIIVDTELANQSARFMLVICWLCYKYFFSLQPHLGHLKDSLSNRLQTERENYECLGQQGTIGNTVIQSTKYSITQMMK